MEQAGLKILEIMDSDTGEAVTETSERGRGEKDPSEGICRRNIYGTLYEGDERGPQPSDLCVEPFPA